MPILLQLENHLRHICNMYVEYHDINAAKNSTLTKKMLKYNLMAEKITFSLLNDF